jgi:COMPASS component SPP1
MQSRIDTWAKKGGKKDKLWDSVKNAEKREGVVVRLDEDDNTSSLSDCQGKSDLDCPQEKDTETLKNGALKPAKPKKAKAEREKERLTEALDQVVRTTNDLKKGMGILASREKLLEMATERAETVNQCGWDQRLCYGDEEWAEQGQSVFESYEDRGDGDMDVDGQSDNGEGDWWCPEEAACSRHVGYVPFIYLIGIFC